jgi:N-acetylglutamate synthase-like GNAT family acetyltransferase
MSLSEVRVRRATVDDLPKLTTLWNSMNLSVADLEKRLTEFQIVESAEGDLLGGIGIQIIGRHGRLHSEGFADFSIANHVRPQLWERIRSLAQNHGLVRLWTQETAPFWKQTGFQTASGEVLAKLPAAWTSPDSEWLTQQLRDEQAVEVDLDKEFKQFMEAEKSRTSGIMQQAHLMKQIATVLAIILALGVLVMLIFFAKNRFGVMHH